MLIVIIYHSIRIPNKTDIMFESLESMDSVIREYNIAITKRNSEIKKGPYMSF